MKIYSSQRWDNNEELQAERGHVGIHTITGERAGIRGRGRVIPEEAKEADIYQSNIGRGVS